MTKKMHKGPKIGAPKKEAKMKAKTDAAPKPKQMSAKAKRIEKNQAPKAVENTKNVLFLRGTRTSETVGDCLKELWALRKPFGKMMARKNENMHPFDDEASLEFLCQKNDCSLFMVANHSKKRPHNLVVGRTFDGHVLDMAELGVESATTLAELQAAHPDAHIGTKRLGSKPLVCFLGEAWDVAGSEHSRLRSLLLDLVRGQDVSKVNLASLDHVLCFTVAPDSSGGECRIHLRTYALELRKPASDSGSSVPRAKLVLSAPSMDFRVRRTRWAAKELMKHALKQPREVKAKKIKNVTTTALGDKVGQLHMQRQDYSALQTRKVKALFAHKALPLAKPGPGGAGDDEEGGGNSSGGEGVDEDDQ